MSRAFSRFLFLTAIALGLLHLSACDRTEPSPLAPAVSAKAQLEDPDQLTLENATTVAEALQAWSAGNHYVVPTHLADMNWWSQTVLEYLPEHRLITNPFTGLRSEPRSEDTGDPGTIYFGVPSTAELPYWRVQVKAYGTSGLIYSEWISGRDLPDLDRRTRMNALILQVAVEDWAQANGARYPGDLSELNQNGRTIYDLLPNGQRLENAYTHQRILPWDGLPCCAGEVGYEAVAAIHGGWTYVIQAIGKPGQYVQYWNGPDSHFTNSFYQPSVPHLVDPEITTLKNALVLRGAVERWAQENGGSYPAKLHSTNALGHTVFDLLPGGVRLRNAYSGNSSEPRDGTPSASGQLGYHGIAGIPPYTLYRVEAFGDLGIIWSYDSWRAADSGS